MKKAIRLGYVFERIDYNKYLDDIFDIRRSATIRQGKVSDDFVNNRPVPVNDPESNSLSHDYPYFGVFDPDGKMVAYAGCFLAGEVIELSHFYGHAEHQKNGVGDFDYFLYLCFSFGLVNTSVHSDQILVI